MVEFTVISKRDYGKNCRNRSIFRKYTVEPQKNHYFTVISDRDYSKIGQKQWILP